MKCDLLVYVGRFLSALRKGWFFIYFIFNVPSMPLAFFCRKCGMRFYDIFKGFWWL